MHLPYPLPDLTQVVWDYNSRSDPFAAWSLITSDKVEDISFIPANVTLQCWMNNRTHFQSMKDLKHQYKAYPLIITYENIMIYDEFKNVRLCILFMYIQRPYCLAFLYDDD